MCDALLYLPTLQTPARAPLAGVVQQAPATPAWIATEMARWELSVCDACFHKL